jgi:hypothetical protein
MLIIDYNADIHLLCLLHIYLILSGLLLVCLAQNIILLVLVSELSEGNDLQLERFVILGTKLVTRNLTLHVLRLNRAALQIYLA